MELPVSISAVPVVEATLLTFPELFGVLPAFLSLVMSTQDILSNCLPDWLADSYSDGM